MWCVCHKCGTWLIVNGSPIDGGIRAESSAGMPLCRPCAGPDDIAVFDTSTGRWADTEYREGRDR